MGKEIVYCVSCGDRIPASDFEKIKEQVREACAMEMMNNLVAHERKVAKIEINLAGESGPIQPVSHQRLEVEDRK